MKNHPAEISALTAVVKYAFAELKMLHKTVGSDAHKAIQLVEKWLSGAQIAAEEFEAAAQAAHQDDVPREKREQDRALSWANSAAGNLAYVALKRRDWQDGMRTVMEAALYALSSAGQDAEAVDIILKKTRSAALRKPSPAVTKLKPPKAQPPRKFDRAELVALLKKHKYPDHEAVISFDEKYGGLKMKEDGWVIGAYDCLTSRAHVDPRGESNRAGKAALVPVAYSPNDVIFFLDGHGVAWVHDTIEGELEKFAPNAKSMMAKIVT